MPLNQKNLKRELGFHYDISTGIIVTAVTKQVSETAVILLCLYLPGQREPRHAVCAVTIPRWRRNCKKAYFVITLSFLSSRYHGVKVER